MFDFAAYTVFKNEYSTKSGRMTCLGRLYRLFFKFRKKIC